MTFGVDPAVSNKSNSKLEPSQSITDLHIFLVNYNIISRYVIYVTEMQSKGKSKRSKV